MTDGPKRSARTLATLCVMAFGGSMLVAAPTSAKPDIDTVQTRVDLSRQQILRFAHNERLEFFASL